jgi:hypothetical protein
MAIETSCPWNNGDVIFDTSVPKMLKKLKSFCIYFTSWGREEIVLNKITPISCVRKKFRFDIDEFPDVRMCIKV